MGRSLAPQPHCATHCFCCFARTRCTGRSLLNFHRALKGHRGPTWHQHGHWKGEPATSDAQINVPHSLGAAPWLLSCPVSAGLQLESSAQWGQRLTAAGPRTAVCKAVAYTFSAPKRRKRLGLFVCLIRADSEWQRK